MCVDILFYVNVISLLAVSAKLLSISVLCLFLREPFHSCLASCPGVVRRFDARYKVYMGPPPRQSAAKRGR